jgi:hypothetical protein
MRIAPIWILALVSGCGGPAAATDDAAMRADAGPGVDVGPGHDAASGEDAFVAGNDAATGVCSPTAGSAMMTTGCDLLQLAVIEHDGAPTELILTGRIYSVTGAMDECAVVDGVDIVQSSATSTVIQHLDGGASIALDSAEREIARGVPVAALTDVCATDDPAMRFDSFGIVVRGRVDGGTFEAHCARAEGGGRWPPALRVTCHRNVDAPPFSGNASVTRSSFMGHAFESTMLYAAASHGPTGALTSVVGTIHVIPRRSIFDSGAPIAPFDTTGWMGSANESGSTPSYSQLQAFASVAQFDMELCPPPMTGTPGPGFIPPPVFLARLTGVGGHGSYSTEVFVNQCNTTSGP